MSDWMQRADLERSENWREWVGRMPAIQFKPEWKVKILPPFAKAMARFYIDIDNAHVSVYLDVNDSLGSVGQPYWEIYPYNDDTCRVYMNDTDELVEKISEALEQQTKTPLQD